MLGRSVGPQSLRYGRNVSHQINDAIKSPESKAITMMPSQLGNGSRRTIRPCRRSLRADGRRRHRNRLVGESSIVLFLDEGNNLGS